MDENENNIHIFQSKNTSKKNSTQLIKMNSAILAGGKASRMMYQNKAFIQIQGIPIIRRTINLLDKIFDGIFLVTNSPKDYKDYEDKCYIITDIIKDVGPLGGIHSALTYAFHEGIFFVACDMPFLHNEVIYQLIYCFEKEECDVVVPRIGSLIEPLCGIYKKNLKDILQDFIKNNDYTIKNFLNIVNTYYLDLKDNSYNHKIFENINTKRDLERII